KRSDQVGDKIFIDGNSAAALGCVYGGGTFASWYPITPSSSLAEAFGSYCEKYRIEPETDKKRYAMLQAEDELAAIGMVIGAGWNGSRAFTATSGPGISLMSEFLGLAYFAEIPSVIFDVQRTGPSTGMPTRTQQSDILACAYASHGDTKHLLLIPNDPFECFELSAQAFDLADHFQTPVIVITDLDIGMNDHITKPFEWDDSRRYNRGKIMTQEDLDAGRDFGRYLDVDGDGVCYRTYPGTHPERGSFFTRGTSRDPYARYTEDGKIYAENMRRLDLKFETAARALPAPVTQIAPEETDLAVIYYGSTSHAMQESLDQLADQGLTLNAMRLRAFPFSPDVKNFIDQHSAIIVVEQNRDAQMRTLLINELEILPEKLMPVTYFEGSPITAKYITAEVLKRLSPNKVTPLRGAQK
ncbi:MAG TPA: 2-oxoacid:acceptor oxidoreductase subunit alpha, partial [Gammaproteobacteria bacterium]|nr:2-oxoacid:acceptor oxidoreductase subunit alpha [Gammaproteobacteria bacterium]